MTGPTVIVTGAMALAFAMIHIFVGRLAVLDTIPRSRWLSFAGGVAVAYVFLHILPELGAHQAFLADATALDPLTVEKAVYAVALAGIACFYGVERAVKLHRYSQTASGDAEPRAHALLLLHLASFGLFNLLIGYLLLHRDEFGAWNLALYFVAMALHFVTSDFGMRGEDPRLYDRAGRWIIALAVIGGWAIGVLVAVPRVAVAFLFAFVAGGVILNVLKEELPEERQSRFWPFIGGVLAYAALAIVESSLA